MTTPTTVQYKGQSQLRVRCPYCEKVGTVKKEQSFGRDLTLRTYECGHTVTHRGATQTREEEITGLKSLTGKTLLPFQIENVVATEKAGLRAGILDEMGLGKTIQACALLKLHPEMFPVMIFCKSKLKEQWRNHLIDWLGIEHIPQVIDKGYEKLDPSFDVYVVSLDMLRRVKWIEQMKGKLKSVIIDEVQLVKNPGAERTQLARDLCVNPEFVIGLSGTPINNHAGEYFTFLNILRPDVFGSEERFMRYDVKWVEVGVKADGITPKLKPGGLADPADFKRKTQGWLFRHTVEQVQPQLPKINRIPRICDLATEVEKKYGESMRDFDRVFNDHEMDRGEQAVNLLAIISKLRHLVGYSLVPVVIDMAADFLIENGRKLAIGHHHQDVGGMLELQLRDLCADGGFKPPIRLMGDLDAEEYGRRLRQFQTDPESRVILLRELGDGEGIDLQMCSDAILMERQWNPGKEEQFERRFPRIGYSGELSHINVYYPTPIGTIAEMFAEIVARKRTYMAQTLDGKELVWDEEDILQELYKALSTKGMKRWRL